jgi:hypothetical protein
MQVVINGLPKGALYFLDALPLAGDDIPQIEHLPVQNAGFVTSNPTQPS